MHALPRRSARSGYLLLVVVWCSWGLSYPLTAIALRYLDVWTLRCAVTGIAAVILLGNAAARGEPIGIPRGERLDLVIAALFNISVFQIGMTYGVSLLSPGRTAVIVYTMPVWAALFAMLILRERLSAERLIALLLGVAAITILLDQDLSNLTNAPIGAALTLMASVSFGFGTVWMKRRRWITPPAVSGGWQLAIGLIPLAAIWGVIAPPQHWDSVGWDGWLSIIYLVLASNVLAYIAWFRVIAIFPAMISGIGTLAVPVIGVLTSTALVGEAMGWRELSALLCVCMALALVLFGPTWRIRSGMSH